MAVGATHCYAPFPYSLLAIRHSQVHIPAARFRPSHVHIVAPMKSRAQGMPDAQCTRSLVCEVVSKHTSVVATGSPESNRHSLRDGFTAYSVVAPVCRAC